MEKILDQPKCLTYNLLSTFLIIIQPVPQSFIYLFIYFSIIFSFKFNNNCYFVMCLRYLICDVSFDNEVAM